MLSPFLLQIVCILHRGLILFSGFSCIAAKRIKIVHLMSKPIKLPVYRQIRDIGIMMPFHIFTSSSIVSLNNDVQYGII